jgi:hypothetical protein
MPEPIPAAKSISAGNRRASDAPQRFSPPTLILVARGRVPVINPKKLHLKPILRRLPLFAPAVMTTCQVRYLRSEPEVVKAGFERRGCAAVLPPDDDGSAPACRGRRRSFLGRSKRHDLRLPQRPISPVILLSMREATTSVGLIAPAHFGEMEPPLKAWRQRFLTSDPDRCDGVARGPT